MMHGCLLYVQRNLYPLKRDGYMIEMDKLCAVIACSAHATQRILRMFPDSHKTRTSAVSRQAGSAQTFAR